MEAGRAADAHNRGMEAQNGDLEDVYSRPVAMEAQNGALEDLYSRPVVVDSHHDEEQDLDPH
jgi:hypothetical protein